MKEIQLIRQLFPDFRTVPWEHYYDLGDFERTLSAFAITGGPRNYRTGSLINNHIGLIGLGAGFGPVKPSLLPCEFVYLYASHMASVNSPLNLTRAKDWDLILPEPVTLQDLADYIESANALRNQSIAQLDDIRAWLNEFEANLDYCYIYGAHGRAALEMDTTIKCKLEPRDRVRLIAPLHQAWNSAKVQWEGLVQERLHGIASRRSPIERLNKLRESRRSKSGAKK